MNTTIINAATIAAAAGSFESNPMPLEHGLYSNLRQQL